MFADQVISMRNLTSQGRIFFTRSKYHLQNKLAGLNVEISLHFLRFVQKRYYVITF